MTITQLSKSSYKTFEEGNTTVTANGKPLLRIRSFRIFTDVNIDKREPWSSVSRWSVSKWKEFFKTRKVLVVTAYSWPSFVVELWKEADDN